MRPSRTLVAVAFALSLVMAGSAPVAVRQVSNQTAIVLDHSVSDMLPATAKVELLKGDYFGFLEGPIWVPEGASGYLLFIDIAANRIYKWTTDKHLSVFWERPGRTGQPGDWYRTQAGEELATHFNGRLAVILYGPCGLALDPQGRVVMADIADRSVARLEKDGRRTVLADHYEGKRLSGPNDIVVRSDGTVYFTDMPAGMRYTSKDPHRELPFDSVFVLKDGQVRLIDKNPFDIVPNGITLSADEKYLYTGGSRRVVRYDVRPDGSAVNGRLLVDMRNEKQRGGPDGMRTDQRGHLWTTGPGGIWIVSPEGQHLGTIQMPEGEQAISFAFGDPEKGAYRSVYVVTPSSLFRVRGVNIPVPAPRTTPVVQNRTPQRPNGKAASNE